VATTTSSRARPQRSSRLHERAERARRTEQVLADLDQLDLERDQHRRRELVDELVRVNMGMARSIAFRYRHRGINDEDLEQVAYLALARAAQVYDHGSGHDFMAYAVPCIRGEIRRYFRDHGWMVRPPRRIQEIQCRITAAASDLTIDLGHSPTAGELAPVLGEAESDVREAMAANGCFFPTSLDQPVPTVSPSVGDTLGHEETGLGGAEARVVLAPVVRRLSDRERRILGMRFFAGCTQQEIAEEIGVTQMQVSRLLSDLMAHLRAELESVGDEDRC
jgi:RNA polymerase sigma-B factor